MSKRVMLLFLLLFFAILIFIFPLTSIPIISNLVQKVAGPPKSMIYKTKINLIKKEDEKLTKENQKLQKALVDYERQKKDNLVLRDQFETPVTSNFKLLPARILGSQGNFLHPTAIIIDQGSRAKIKKGMAVILKDYLLGKIESVSENYSKVALVQNEKFSTLARTNQTSALGVVRGAGDFIILDQVSVNENINMGDLLLTRGEINDEGFGIPPDFIIGKISSVNKNESLPNQSAKIEKIIDPARIDMVFVLISI